MAAETGPHKTGIEDYYIVKNNKKMRCGFTTGTCAAAAAKGAAGILLESLLKFGEGNDLGETEEKNRYFLNLTTPKGISLCLKLEDIKKGDGWVSCGVRKDAGDDPDITDGLLVYARVEKIEEPRITLRGGEGVGRVTKKGLEQPIGAAAINNTPRRMIEEGLHELMEISGYSGGLAVTISVPGGKEIAAKTFNPRLGIEGGISILGTSGIVEPMSEAALLKSIEIELSQQLANGRKDIIVTLGNYGKAYLESLDWLPIKESIKCSNYVGEVIDMAVAGGAESLLFVAHLGKFVKVAGGIMNTHSRCADSRAEIMAACAMRAGIDYQGALKILDTVTTDEAIAILKEKKLLDQTMTIMMEKIEFYLRNRAYDRINLQAIVFSNQHGFLGETRGCKSLIEKIKNQDKE